MTILMLDIGFLPLGFIVLRRLWFPAMMGRVIDAGKTDQEDTQGLLGGD
jgi:hypothetical protein